MSVLDYFFSTCFSNLFQGKSTFFLKDQFLQKYANEKNK